jgi:FlgN protein.
LEVIENLNKNLKQQVKLYEELLSLEERKQKALIENNLQEIDATTSLEEKVMSEASLMERERLQWASAIGRDLGKKPEDLTLAELAESFPVLNEVRSDLDLVVHRLQTIHVINAQLLEQAMKIVEFTVGMLTHQEKGTYTHPHRKENEENRKLHLLDWRI